MAPEQAGRKMLDLSDVEGLEAALNRLRRRLPQAPTSAGDVALSQAVREALLAVREAKRVDPARGGAKLAGGAK